MPASPGSVDVHQHLWPPSVPRRAATPLPTSHAAWVDALRRGRGAVRRGPGGPRRRAPRGIELAAGRDLVLLSMSTPLGVEGLPTTERGELLDAWHEGVLSLPTPFRAWASVADRDPDPDEITAAVKDGFVGLQVGAQLMLDPQALEALGARAPAVRGARRPGPRAPGAGDARPGRTGLVARGPPVRRAAAGSVVGVGSGRELTPPLAPHLLRGGCRAGPAAPRALRGPWRRAAARSTRRVFVDTSSYGRQAVDHLTRALGIDPLVLGSDRPYAEPIDRTLETDLGDAARHAISVRNPRRLLEGTTS